MKKLLLFFLFLIVCLQAFSQTWRRSAHWGNDYTAIHWVNAEVGYLSGQNIILKTIDGGLSWLEQEPPTKTRMLSVDFFNQNIGMMAGENGQLFRTQDGGDTWTLSNLPSTEKLTRIRYLDQQRVMVVGHNGTAFLSQNGGATWTRQSLPGQGDYNSLFFVDNSLGFISTSNSEILKTTNGGQSWQVLPTAFESNLKDVYFTNDTIGYTVGTAGTILKTENGGMNWTFINSGVDTDYTRISFSKTNPAIGLFAGESGFLMRTTNAGLTVSAVGSRTTQDINDIQFRENTNVVFAVCNSGVLISSTNSGGGWALRLSGQRKNFNATHFTSASHGYIVGEAGLILSTNNGGSSFADRSRPVSLPFSSLYFTTNTLGYVGGTQGNILKTTNSGGGWTALNPGTTRSINGLYFFNNNLGYAVGSRGYISKTENGGVNWTTIDPGNGSTQYTGIKFFNADKGLIIGENGYISTIEENGKREVIHIGTSTDWKSIAILDEQTAMIAGKAGELWKTQDQGQNWEKVTTTFSEDFNGITFLDESVGFIAGTKGLILKTENGGQAWEKIHTGTYQDFTGISFGDLNTGFAVGESGTFFKYSCLVPVKPAVIFGEDNICISQQAYHIQGSTEEGVSYEWRVDGGNILEGQGGTRIVVEWDNPGRHAVMVRGQNNCGNSPTTALEVIVSGQPGQASPIRGDGTLCIDSIEFYEVDSLAGTEYYWETSGGIIREGQGTSRVSVEWTNLNNHKLKVSPINPCGAGTMVEKDIRVITSPSQPAAITGPAMSGLGMEEEYKITAQPDLSYQWSLSGGGQILSGQGTAAIKVKWSQEGTHTLQLTPTNSCGTGEARVLEVTVDFVTAVEKAEDSRWKIYPNPSAGEIFVDFAGLGEVRSIEIYNALGQKIKDMPVEGVAKTVEIQQLPKGVHTLRLRTRTGEHLKKIIVH